MDKNGLITLWKDFAERSDYFKLNPEKDFVGLLAEGVLTNEKNKGFRNCPCRLSDGSYEKNVDLLCPCNFKSQANWAEKGRCWCGLFFRK